MFPGLEMHWCRWYLTVLWVLFRYRLSDPRSFGEINSYTDSQRINSLLKKHFQEEQNIKQQFRKALKGQCVSVTFD